MATKTNLYMDWKPITVTPAGGSAIVLNEHTKFDVSIEDALETWRSMGHKFASVVVVGTSERGGTIEGGDCYQLTTIPKGTPCTIVAVLNDALNIAGSGALTFTFANAIFAGSGISGTVRKFATGAMSFSCFSPDGSTDPLTIAQAS